jgi:hypothetical protein
MDTATAVRAKMTGRLPAGSNWNDVRQALSLATRRYRSMGHELRRKLREGGA